MTTVHDPAEIDRLIVQAREDDERMRPAPWRRSHYHHETTIDGGSGAIADVLGSSREQRELDADAVARQRNDLRAVADQLDATRAVLREVRRGYECGSWMIVGDAIGTGRDARDVPARPAAGDVAAGTQVVQVEQDLRQALRHPVEPGLDHPAEVVVLRALAEDRAGGRRVLRAALDDLVADPAPVLRARAIALAARTAPAGDVVRLARAALSDPAVEVRDAAIGALEAVGDQAALESLRCHHEEVPWLAEYLGRVVADLELTTARIFTAERRARVSAESPRGAYVPPQDARTPERLAEHVERIVCSLWDWPGNSQSNAELVYRTVLCAMRQLLEVTRDVAPADAIVGPRDWSGVVARINALRATLDDKPVELRVGHSLAAGSVLNAYREGDLSFDEAREVLESVEFSNACTSRRTSR